MIGKVAHIYAAEKGGARFEENMSNEDRRAIENLFVVCANCHDVIDDKANEDKFPAELLKRYKKQHEERFRKAELQFLEEYADLTQQTMPKMPNNLKRLSKALKIEEICTAKEEVDGVRQFVEKLSELPLNQRRFALRIAERMKRRDLGGLPVQEVISVFRISHAKLKSNMELIEDHCLGSIDEDHIPGKYIVSLWDRKPGGNPWIEILDFCEVSGDDPDEFVMELNFALYDEKQSEEKS